MLRQRDTRPGQSDVESGALLDEASGRPVSGGEVTLGLVDEMPEATDLGPTPEDTARAGQAVEAPESSNRSSLTAPANQKPNV